MVRCTLDGSGFSRDPRPSIPVWTRSSEHATIGQSAISCNNSSTDVTPLQDIYQSFGILSQRQHRTAGVLRPDRP